MNFKINNDGYIVTKAKMASIRPMEYLGEEIGRTSGKVIFLSISPFDAPTISPISSNSELIDRRAAETRRYA